MTAAIPLERWPDHLEMVIAGSCKLLRRVMVLRQTDSTQDSARRLNGRSGEVIVAWRQTAGRGQFGRRWVDTADEGVAMTVVVERDSPQRLVMATALGVARAAESILDRSVTIKQPNDILVDGRKLAGVLVEQTDQLALIGVGMNVGQLYWPDELRDRAISLAQLQKRTDRLRVIEAILVSLDRMLRHSEAQLADELASRGVAECSASR
ncbi:MAG: biotin--[acetyl-CoA-carboxylase] ligase [Phycisphaerales bacterium]|nr:biotin--[acetyl-CoA-carboxylase] ligase [Phycisphaerales bacterium]MCI0629865.1 biotin--[acetyl-CoA-carboxylase] ligase [Phycisphaerales bacterium]MCI0675759.1 biotin--[acetyl-CoA-carboxylase] ligase [Phycisphaerales bacterium]